MIVKVEILDSGTRAWVGETEDKMTRMVMVPEDVKFLSNFLSNMTKRSIDVFKPRNYAQKEGVLPHDSGNGNKGIEGIPEQ